MPADFADHRADLASLEAIGRRRALMPRRGIDFASNDYLGLAASGVLETAARAALDRGVPVGAGAARLLRGNHAEHEALEAEAAAFFGAEAALFVANGYVGNLALLATLPQRGDLIVHDALVHASSHDAMRLSRAPAVAAAHNDADAVADAIAAWRAGGGTGTPWIVVESLYGMDGDRSPLADLASIADRTGGVLVVDEAHATGVFGPGGRGLSAVLEGRGNVVTLHTCGKALGAEGALITGPAVVRDFLVNRARPFIFSTAPSPMLAAVVRAALVHVADDRARAVLLQRIGEARTMLAKLGLPSTESPVQPVQIGDDARAMRVAGAVQAAGYDVRGIRPPTVPPGTARLRLSITANVSARDIAALGEVLKRELR